MSKQDYRLLSISSALIGNQSLPTAEDSPLSKISSPMEARICGHEQESITAGRASLTGQKTTIIARAEIVSDGMISIVDEGSRFSFAGIRFEGQPLKAGSGLRSKRIGCGPGLTTSQSDVVTRA